MTSHDSKPEATKPNDTLRRLKFAAATIGREPSDRGPVGADSHVSEPIELLTDELGIIAANQR